MKRLLFIGPAPQNIGGISIHIRRLTGLIKKDYEVDYVDEGHVRYDGFFNLRSGNVLRYLSKVLRADIIHLHSGTWQLRTIHILICKVLLRKRVIVTIHRDPNIEPHTGLTKRLLKQCDCAILVNMEGYQAMQCESNCKYVLLPAFLPPDMDSEAPLPEELFNWIYDARKNEGSYIMCSNAWNLVMHSGEDLYGLDMCIEAMINLRGEQEKKFNLVFVVASNTGQQERMTSYKKLIAENGLDRRVLIWEKPASFVRLLQLCDLVLRTTNTDGDAVSIREALYFGKPVLASDVVRRPEGAELFKTRDMEDLTEQIRRISSNGAKMKMPPPVDFHALYKNIYEKSNK